MAENERERERRGERHFKRNQFGASVRSNVTPARQRGRERENEKASGKCWPKRSNFTPIPALPIRRLKPREGADASESETKREREREREGERANESEMNVDHEV